MSTALSVRGIIEKETLFRDLHDPDAGVRLKKAARSTASPTVRSAWQKRSRFQNRTSVSRISFEDSVGVIVGFIGVYVTVPPLL